MKLNYIAIVDGIVPDGEAWISLRTFEAMFGKKEEKDCPICGSAEVDGRCMNPSKHYERFSHESD